jgi:hypothetical protein
MQALDLQFANPQMLAFHIERPLPEKNNRVSNHNMRSTSGFVIINKWICDNSSPETLALLFEEASRRSHERPCKGPAEKHAPFKNKVATPDNVINKLTKYKTTDEMHHLTA